MDPGGQGTAGGSSVEGPNCRSRRILRSLVPAALRRLRQASLACGPAVQLQDPVDGVSGFSF
jgi:hypothetical protein